MELCVGRRHVTGMERQAWGCLPKWEGFLVQENPFQNQIWPGVKRHHPGYSTGRVWAKPSCGLKVSQFSPSRAKPRLDAHLRMRIWGSSILPVCCRCSPHRRDKNSEKRQGGVHFHPSSPRKWHLSSDGLQDQFTRTYWMASEKRALLGHTPHRIQNCWIWIAENFAFPKPPSSILTI